MSEHYDGRLVVDKDLGWLVLAADLGCHPVIASTDDTLYDDLPDEDKRLRAQEANARRLAACWNVLRGLSTADLEQIASTPGDAARLAQLAGAAEAAYRKATEPTS